MRLSCKDIDMFMWWKTLTHEKKIYLIKKHQANFLFEKTLDNILIQDIEKIYKFENQ